MMKSTENSKNLAPKSVPQPNFIEELLKLLQSQNPLVKVLEHVRNIMARNPNELYFSPNLTVDELRYKLLIMLYEITKYRPRTCIHCGHHKVHRKGHYRNGRRRYFCPKCHRTFNDFTGTAFSYIHKINEMMQYLETDFFHGTAVRSAANRLNVDYRTVFAWRHRLASALPNDPEKLPNEVVSVVEFFKEISLKASHHYPGRTYKNPKVTIFKLNGNRFVNGITAVDNGEQCSIRLMSFGPIIDQEIGERYLKRCVRANKRMVVSAMGELAKIGKKLKRGKRRIEVEARGKAHHEKWRNLENPNVLQKIAQIWSMKFHGVATKYLNNYLGTISWITAHFREENWFENLLGHLLLNGTALGKYSYLKNLKIE